MEHQKIQEARVKSAMDFIILESKQESGRIRSQIPQQVEALIAAMERERKETWEVLMKKDATFLAVEADLLKQKEDLRRKSSHIERMAARAKLENQRLKEELRSKELELAEVRVQYTEHVKGRDKARKQEKKNKACERETKLEYRKLRTEHIQLRTAVDKLEQENETFKKEHMGKVVDLKTRNTQKEMGLERKLAELTKELEQSDLLAANTPEDVVVKNPCE